MKFFLNKRSLLYRLALLCLIIFVIFSARFFSQNAGISLPGAVSLEVAAGLNINFTLKGLLNSRTTSFSSSSCPMARLQQKVCWNTLQGLTITNPKTSEGIGIGTFVSSITGLSPITTYCVLANSMNSAIINYRNEIYKVHIDACSTSIRIFRFVIKKELHVQK
jgi:hypothetical protein